MQNIFIKKIWCDGNLLELKILALNDYVKITQNCYIDRNTLIENSRKICDYAYKHINCCYIEFGNKTGNYTPAFSIEFFPLNNYGHTKMELDMEIADNTDRKHRCKFYISSEIGLLEQFAHSLTLLADCDNGTEISLLPNTKMT